MINPNKQMGRAPLSLFYCFQPFTPTLSPQVPRLFLNDILCHKFKPYCKQAETMGLLQTTLYDWLLVRNSKICYHQCRHGSKEVQSPSLPTWSSDSHISDEKCERRGGRQV